jgi:membrane protease YdiL (CAAX protease family)
VSLWNRHRISSALAVGGALYVAWWLVCHAFATAAALGLATRQVIFDAGLIVIAIGGWHFTAQPLLRMGLRKPAPRSFRWWWYGIVAGVMAIAGAAAAWLRVSHPVVATLSPWQIVCVVWLLGSIAEEIFIRGFLQSLMYGEDECAACERGIGSDTVASSVFFAVAHAPLLWTTMSGIGVAIVFATALVVGSVAAIARRETKSVVHPIMLHVTSNVIAAVSASVLIATQ